MSLRDEVSAPEWQARVELAACGHSPHRDRPREVIEAFERFLHDRATDGAAGRPGG